MNHSGVTILNFSLICINDTVPEMVKVTNGKGPNMTLFVEFSLRYLKFIADAAKHKSCNENHNLSLMVSTIVKIFAHWYNQQVVRNTKKPMMRPLTKNMGV